MGNWRNITDPTTQMSELLTRSRTSRHKKHRHSTSPEADRIAQREATRRGVAKLSLGDKLVLLEGGEPKGTRPKRNP